MSALIGFLFLLVIWGVRSFFQAGAGPSRPIFRERGIGSSQMVESLLHALISDRGFLRTDTRITDVQGADIGLVRDGSCGRLVLHAVAGFDPDSDLLQIRESASRAKNNGSATLVVVGGDEAFGRRALQASVGGRTLHISDAGVVNERGRGWRSSAPRLIVENALDRMASDLREGGLPAIDADTARSLVTPTPDRRPTARTALRGVVTTALSVAIVVCFAIEVAISPDSLRGEGASVSVAYRLGAIHRASILAGDWQRLIAAPFLHFGVIHIAMNGWAQWSLGGPIEFLVGSWRFLALWVISALGASLTSLMFNDTSVAAGASGAIFGLLGAFTTFVFFRKDVLPQPVPRSLRNGVLATLFLNLMISFIPNIDMAAHAGGFVTGALMAFALGRKEYGPQQPSAFWLRLAVTALVLLGVGVTGVEDKAQAATHAPPTSGVHMVGELRLPIPDGFDVSESRENGMTVVEADGSPASPYVVTFRVSDSQTDDAAARRVLQQFRKSGTPTESTDWIAISRTGLAQNRAIDVIVVSPQSCRDEAEKLSAEIAKKIQ